MAAPRVHGGNVPSGTMRFPDSRRLPAERRISPRGGKDIRHLENADPDTRTRDSRMAERLSGCYCRSRADADSFPAHAVATPEPAIR